MSNQNQYDETNSMVVGIRPITMINTETGEEEELQQITKRFLGHQNFWKIVLMDYLAILGIFDSKQLDVFIYIAQNTNSGNNLFIGTYKKIAEGTGVSEMTIARVLKKLQANNYIKMVQRGVWAVNPNITVKGDPKKQKILLSYYEEKRLGIKIYQK